MLFFRDIANQQLAAHAVSMGESVPVHHKDVTSTKQVTFKDLVSSDMEDSDLEGQQNDTEPQDNWASKSSAYTSALDDASTSYSPYLPPVLEEPSSSFSEGKNSCVLVVIVILKHDVTHCSLILLPS